MENDVFCKCKLYLLLNFIMANKIYIYTYMVDFRKFQNMINNKLTSVCRLGKFAWFFFSFKHLAAGFGIVLETPGWCGSGDENKHISFVPTSQSMIVPELSNTYWAGTRSSYLVEVDRNYLLSWTQLHIPKSLKEFPRSLWSITYSTEKNATQLKRSRNFRKIELS